MNFLTLAPETSVFFGKLFVLQEPKTSAVDVQKPQRESLKLPPAVATLGDSKPGALFPTSMEGENSPFGD